MRKTVQPVVREPGQVALDHREGVGAFPLSATKTMWWATISSLSGSERDSR